jgi:hypothetical protein
MRKPLDIKSADEITLKGWWEALQGNRMAQLLEIFQLTIHCFEYTGLFGGNTLENVNFFLDRLSLIFHEYQFLFSLVQLMIRKIWDFVSLK